MWMAGGGVKGGIAYGATDELRLRGRRGQGPRPRLHATILHLLGLDHEKLTYRYAGRDFRLTDVKGNVVKGDPRVVPSGPATSFPSPSNAGERESMRAATRTSRSMRLVA